ncbi:MAG TPA: MOSC domain-containing protein [Bryobacteraceae bacterium]|nr:MOSC domain-containing protein [Bryobacteraceae bacterium]
MAINQTAGSVLQINVSKGGVLKRAVQEGVVTELGIAGDEQAHPEFHGGPRQALLFIAAEGIEELKQAGFAVFPGALGENITTTGLDRRAWRIGQRWRVGPEVVVEFTKVRVPCRALNRYGAGRIQKAVYDEVIHAGDPSSPHWGLSGFYARVVEGGTIRTGDKISPA